MKHIVVDLEMNISSKKTRMDEGVSETIEIGAVMLDDNLQEISSFRTYVKPVINPHITTLIQRLTGITDSMVENAPMFEEALRMFTNWCLGTGDEITVYAWSDTDYHQIQKDIEQKNYVVSEKEKIILEKEWTDFQYEFGGRLGFVKQVSLKEALKMAGIDFAGREHDALDDARNTADLLQIFNDEDLFETTLRKIEEVMNPVEECCTLGSLIDFSKFNFA